jgi:hypothetical protein
VLEVLMKNFVKLLGGFMPEAEPKVRLHDPLTVAALVHPELADFEPTRVSAFGTPGACRMVTSSHGRAVDGCQSVDNPALTALLVKTLTSRPDA